MLITRTSPLSGTKRTWDLPITLEQLQAFEDGKIQVALVHLTPAQREWILTGLSPSEYEELQPPMNIVHGGQ